MTFRAPARDLAFALTEIAGIDRLIATGAYPDYDADLMAAVLEASASLCEDVLAPLNRPGDLEGARYENGRVYAPKGFPEAFKAYTEGGWTSLAVDPEYGGQGLPHALAAACAEMMFAANTAFGLLPSVSAGAIKAIAKQGTERQKALYLPKLTSGEWSAAMDLTEPQAGTDLALLRTRAEPDGAGGYKLYGQKIFITWGDHDCADNIVHLVLARLPDAPEGTKGISLFVCPTYLVDDAGTIGARNDFRPGGIEHKMGIHGSPTCVMLYEGARAELVGPPHGGLAAMFIMMNAARLDVGIQGVGVAERAYQQALAYALDRRQGKSAWTGEAGAPIFDHPDVRRMLGLMRAKIDAARAICLSGAVAADLALHAAEEAERKRWKMREELFTPIAKAWSTDMGVEVTSLAVQIHGGSGFVEETGVAQYYRDVRITPIYEGTNGIQAMDLANRKLGMEDGAAVRDLVADIRATLAELQGGELADICASLTTALEALEDATAWMSARRGQPDALAGATAYLTLMGDVVGGWMLLRQAARREGARGAPLARTYAEQVLSRAPGLATAVTAGAGSLAALDAEALTAA
jgi:alkylation response protein AidB-like acyl-CoA dehydrogenase